MEYILIPSKSKTETTFFLNLLKKMQKEASTLSIDELEDLVFLNLMKQAEKSPKGNLNSSKTHLKKIVNS